MVTGSVEMAKFIGAGVVIAVVISEQIVVPERVMRDVYAIVVVTELVETARTGADVGDAVAGAENGSVVDSELVVVSEYIADSVVITGAGGVVVSGELGGAELVVASVYVADSVVIAGAGGVVISGELGEVTSLVVVESQ